MKRACIAILIMGCMLIGGCAMQDIETQAYAVSLGIDRQANGDICVSVQMPSLTQGGGSGGGSGGGGGNEAEGGGSYVFLTASGRSLTGALETLHASIPRALNLTGVRNVVVSRTLAEEGMLIELLEEMALAYRVYGAAELVICEGEAREFIKNQKVLIGVRLSESTAVALRHYQETGNIPNARAADVYELSKSVYGDPLAILAARGPEEKMQVSETEEYAGGLEAEGDKREQYYGSALLRAGRMTGMLTGAQTQLIRMLLGDLPYFSRMIDDTPVRLNLSGKPAIQAELGSEPIRIYVKLTVNVMDSEKNLTADRVREVLAEEIAEMTAYCQRCGTDPFRYAEAAAGQFLTVREWLDFDWHARFEQAEIIYDLTVNEAEL